MTFINTQTHKTKNILTMHLQLMIQMAKHYIAQDFFHHSSGGGNELASYKFVTAGDFKSTITIYGVLFQPVNPDQANFTITTTH
jgi:hypothetical protein